MQAPQRTALSGPALIRLLARLTDAELRESGQSLSDRLSQWLDWTDAISLSTALGGQPPAASAGNTVHTAHTANSATGATGASATGSAEDIESARVRASLVAAITGDVAPGHTKRRSHAQARDQRNPAGQDSAAELPVDYPVLRQQYQSAQQSMETAIGALRGRLRNALAARTPAMTRLAVVDAVMERALGARERSLLAAVPSMLEAHFARLRDAAHDSTQDAGTVAPGAWLDAFRKDMQSVLLAELDVRFQPVEGLLAALRSS